jgi:uncharacterized protein (TIGR00369 family)
MSDRFSSHPAGYGVVPPQEAGALSGADFLKAMMAGRFPAPPFSRWARMHLVEVEEGRVVFEGEPTEDMLNPLGTIHGGWTGALIDSVMACAVHSVLKPGEAYTTAEFKVHFVRPLSPASGIVRAEGVLLSRSKRLATSEGRVYAGGKLIAHGSETAMILEVPGGRAS